MKCQKKFLIITLWLSLIKAENTQNYFSNFDCSSDHCRIDGITSTEHLEEIYNQLVSNDFQYFEQDDDDDYNCLYYGRSYCTYKTIRKDIIHYTSFAFSNSKFEKFPPKDNQELNHITSLYAVNVGLIELNRDDLKPFKSLQILNLSENKITTLGNLFLLHVNSLETLNLRKNQITKIDSLAFDESSNNLSFLDLSFNKLTEISENLVDMIGKNDNCQLLLNSNLIETKTQATTFVNSSRKFGTLDLSENKLKTFVYNCSSIQKLTLNKNQLENFEIDNCFVNDLNLNDNNLQNLKVSSGEKLSISNNINLQNLSANFDNLVTLEIQNLPAKLLTYETLKNSSKLKTFDAANTFLGTPKYDAFAEMNSIKFMNLSYTGLSHIEYGMFSHQKLVTIFDISGNNLENIDINMFASMKDLKTFGIRNNNLTKIDHIEEIKNIFPSLETIFIDGNQWNCSYLAKLMNILSEKSIEIEKPLNPVKDSPNLLGIACVTAAQMKIQPVSADQANEAISNKLNEIIEQKNNEKTKKENHKFDFDVIKSEIFGIQKKILDVETKIIQNRMDLNLKQASSSNSSVDIIAIKTMMEQLINITLEKQKIAYDQLVNKINEQGIETKVLGVEIDRLKTAVQIPLKTEKESHNYQPLKHSNQNEVHKGASATEVLLIMLITSLVIVAVIFGYTKLKQSLYAHSNMMNVRARSTNTMNTTIELPFSEQCR